MIYCRYESIHSLCNIVPTRKANRKLPISQEGIEIILCVLLPPPPPSSSSSSSSSSSLLLTPPVLDEYRLFQDVDGNPTDPHEDWLARRKEEEEEEEEEEREEEEE